MFGDFPSSHNHRFSEKWGVSPTGSLHSPKLMKANNFGVQNFWPEAFFRSPDGFCFSHNHGSVWQSSFERLKLTNIAPETGF